MANISKIKLPSGVTYDVVDEKSGYITSASLPTKTSDLTNDSGFITGYTETDPTVPAWAKASTKPTYTASEVGALPDTTTIPTITINGTSTTSASFYAPTSAGTWGQVLRSNGTGAPAWVTIDKGAQVQIVRW